MRTIRIEVWDYIENCEPELIEIIETNNPSRVKSIVKELSEAFGADDGEFSRMINIITQDDHGLKGKCIPNPLRRK